MTARRRKLRTFASQDEVFASGEADAWYARNRAALRDPHKLEIDLPLRVIAELPSPPRRVLEVGGSDGFRLAAIRER